MQCVIQRTCEYARRTESVEGGRAIGVALAAGTLVVCEKKTPLEILQRNLSALRLVLGASLAGQNAARQVEAWTGDKFSCIVTNVQERDGVVARAHRNRSDIERLPGDGGEALARRTQLVLDEVARLQSDVASEEQKFARHKRITRSPSALGSTCARPSRS